MDNSPNFVRVAVCIFVIIADNFCMDKTLLKKLAKRIKELRKIHHFTQDELSYRAKIGRSTLGNIETAQNDVTFTKISRIAKAFNLSLSEFLNF
jgi:DNA-binding XRE family transcriptional regulator